MPTLSGLLQQTVPPSGTRSPSLFLFLSALGAGLVVVRRREEVEDDGSVAAAEGRFILLAQGKLA